MHLLCQIREYTSFYLEHFDWQNPLELLFVSSKGNVLVQSHGRSTPFYKTYILPKNWASKLISVSYKVHQLAHNWLAKQAGKFLLSCHLVLFFCIVPLFICYAYVMAKKKKKTNKNTIHSNLQYLVGLLWCILHVQVCDTIFFGHLILSVEPFINTVSPAYSQKFIVASPLRPIDKILESGNSCSLYGLQN